MHCNNYYHYFFLITLHFTKAEVIQKPRNYLALPLQLCFRRTFLCKINPHWLCHIVRFPFFSPVFLRFSIFFFPTKEVVGLSQADTQSQAKKFASQSQNRASSEKSMHRQVIFSVLGISYTFFLLHIGHTKPTLLQRKMNANGSSHRHTPSGKYWRLLVQGLYQGKSSRNSKNYSLLKLSQTITEGNENVLCHFNVLLF